MHGLVSRATTGLDHPHSHHLSSQLDSCSAALEPLDDNMLRFKICIPEELNRQTCDRYSASPESEGVPKKVQTTGINIPDLQLFPSEP